MKNLEGLCGCGNDDRKAIINICVMSAKYFNNKASTKDINDALKENNQPPLTEDEMKSLNLTD